MGSQASRDALLEGRDEFAMAAHIGSMSIISALWPRGAPAEVIMKAAASTSKDGQRMLLHDMCKTVVGALQHTPFDWLLIDMIEERFPLMSIGASLLTCSGDLRRLNLSGTCEGLATDAPARFALWQASIESLMEIVPPSKIVLNRVLWAGMNYDGSQVVSSQVMHAHNARLDRMYDYLAPRVAHVIDYPEELRYADPYNPWGVSPFHYTTQFYQHTLESLSRLTRVAAR